jgi:hypothetical protein
MAIRQVQRSGFESSRFRELRFRIQCSKVSRFEEIENRS